MNNTKVFVLVAGMMALFGVVGQALGGRGGMIIALLIAGAMNFIMFFNSSLGACPSNVGRSEKVARREQMHANSRRIVGAI
jgi:hypothetical protein